MMALGAVLINNSTLTPQETSGKIVAEIKRRLKLE
jgi:hypothetical protein